MTRQRKPIARHVRPKAKRAKPRRTSVLRDRKYLDWLKEQKCAVCYHIHCWGEVRQCREAHSPFVVGNRIIDPAHGPANGASSKGQDNEAISLCRHHHIEQHQIGWPLFEVKYGIDRAKESAALYVLWRIVSGAEPKEEA